MATEESITLPLAPGVPAVWLEQYGPEDRYTEIVIVDAVSAFLRRVEALATAVESHGDAPPAVTALGEVLCCTVEEMRDWLDRWNEAAKAARRDEASVNVDELVERFRADQHQPAEVSDREARQMAAALDAGIAAGLEVTEEARAAFGEVVGRLVSGLAEIERLATQVDDDYQRRLDVVALLAKGMMNAPQELLDRSGHAAADAAGDAVERLYAVALTSSGADTAYELREAAKTIGELMAYVYDVDDDSSLHAGTLGERVYREAMTALTRLLTLADQVDGAVEHKVPAASVVNHLSDSVQELLSEPLSADEAESLAGAFRAAAGGDLQMAVRVVGNMERNRRRAREGVEA